MIIRWSDHQDVYAELLARAAQRENRAAFGKRPLPASNRREIWARVFSAINDEPKTALAIAELVAMPVDTVRRHLAGLYSVGAISRAPQTTAPRGGYNPAEWVRSKEAK